MDDLICENDNHMIGADFKALKKHEPKPPSAWKEEALKKLDQINERFGYNRKKTAS